MLAAACSDRGPSARSANTGNREVSRDLLELFPYVSNIDMHRPVARAQSLVEY
jgi:hypothetical protein